MRILLVNYRYFVSGGPEKYLFNIQKRLTDEGHEVIPFSVHSNRNVPTPYDRYFVEPIGGRDVTYYDEYRKTPRVLWQMIARSVYSLEVKRAIRRVIRDTRPDLVYIIHFVNKLSPSVIRGAKEMGLPVVLRLSDYFLLCPRFDFLYRNQICEECLTHGLRAGLRRRCVKGSLFATAVRVLSMTVHRWMRVYDQVDAFVAPSAFLRQKMIDAGYAADRLVCIPTFTAQTGPAAMEGAQAADAPAVKSPPTGSAPGADGSPAGADTCAAPVATVAGDKETAPAASTAASIAPIRSAMPTAASAASATPAAASVAPAAPATPATQAADPYGLYFGRITEEKGVETAILAYEGLPAAYRLVVMGDDTTAEALRLKRYLAERGMRNVTFLGFREGAALEAVVREARFVIIPSLWYDNLPNTALEAFQFGKPVLASRIGSLPELVTDGYNGYLFQPGDAADLREKILLLDAEERLGMLGRNAREQLALRFSPDAHYRALTALFQRAVDRSRKEKEAQ